MKGKFRKNCLSLVLVILGISLITFILIRHTNGNPARTILGSDLNMVPRETIEYVENQLGIDKPIHIQYLNWLKKILALDFGNSFISGQPVIRELLSRFPLTLVIAMSSIVFSLIISFPLGIFLAWQENSIFSKLIHGLAMIFISLPSFLLALGLIYIFAIKLHLLPVIPDYRNYNLLLPIASYSLPLISTYTIMIKNSIKAVLKEEYVITAKVKGLSLVDITNRHVLKNSLLPIIPIVGMNISSLLGGSFIIESIFSLPGIGKYAIDSIFLNDYPVIQAYTVFLAIIIVLINFLIDNLYEKIDPRMKVK